MQRADLLPELQRRVLAELAPPDHLTLFRCSRALARMMLLHATSSKQFTRTGNSPWPPALAHVLDDPSLQPLADLELRIRMPAGARMVPHPPRAPPSHLTHHVARLHLSGLRFSPHAIALWRLHDAALWPHLEHLAITQCPLPPTPKSAQPLRPIPRLLSFTWEHAEEVDAPGAVAMLSLVGLAKRLRVVHRWG